MTNPSNQDLMLKMAKRLAIRTAAYHEARMRMDKFGGRDNELEVRMAYSVMCDTQDAMNRYAEAVATARLMVE